MYFIEKALIRPSGRADADGRRNGDGNGRGRRRESRVRDPLVRPLPPRHEELYANLRTNLTIPPFPVYLISDILL